MLQKSLKNSFLKNIGTLLEQIINPGLGQPGQEGRVLDAAVGLNVKKVKIYLYEKHEEMQKEGLCKQNAEAAEFAHFCPYF